MKFLAVVFVFCFLITPDACGEMTFTAKPVGAPEFITLHLEKYGVLFDYPYDWSPGDRNDRCAIVYKKNFAQVNINYFKLPADCKTLEKFVRRVKNTMNPPYTLLKDRGMETIRGKRFWVHDLNKKGAGRANFTAFFMLTEKDYGLWILATYGGKKSRMEVLDVVCSVRKPGEQKQKPPKPPKALPIPVEPVKAKSTEIDSMKKTQKASSPGNRYTVFGQQHETGAFKGKVFLVDLKAKNDYPVYLAFYPMVRIKNDLPKKACSNFRICGDPVFTATDRRGSYKIDIPEGLWWVEAYNKEGRVWELVTGGDVFKRSKTKKMKLFKINNKLY